MMPAPLLLLAFMALATGVATGAKLPRTWLALMMAGTLAAMGAALSVLFGTVDWEAAASAARWHKRCVCRAAVGGGWCGCRLCE